jgi:glycerol uptake facilitator-like aquaporin
MNKSLPRRAVAEFTGTLFLVATVVGSSVMAERLANGNVALALLANTIATGAALVALIFTFGGISGAHFNPVVTAMDAFERGLPWREVPLYVAAQMLGGIIGAVVAHFMFGLPPIFFSHHARSGDAQVFSEFVGTCVLMCVIWGCSRWRSSAVPFTVGACITAVLLPRRSQIQPSLSRAPLVTRSPEFDQPTHRGL